MFKNNNNRRNHSTAELHVGGDQEPPISAYDVMWSTVIAQAAPGETASNQLSTAKERKGSLRNGLSELGPALNAVADVSTALNRELPSLADNANSALVGIKGVCNHLDFQLSQSSKLTSNLHHLDTILAALTFTTAMSRLLQLCLVVLLPCVSLLICIYALMATNLVWLAQVCAVAILTWCGVCSVLIGPQLIGILLPSNEPVPVPCNDSNTES